MEGGDTITYGYSIFATALFCEFALELGDLGALSKEQESQRLNHSSNVGLINHPVAIREKVHDYDRYSRCFNFSTNPKKGLFSFSLKIQQS